MIFPIVGSLLGGWILSLFGFDGVVIAGMLQVFGLTIDSLGYYFLFASAGVLKSVLNFNKDSVIKFNLGEKYSKYSKDKNKEKKEV